MLIRSYWELSVQSLVCVCYLCADRRHCCGLGMQILSLPLEHPGYANGGNKGPWLSLFQSASTPGGC